MSDGLVVGVERDVVFNTLIQDKSPIMISPVVKKGVPVESMTLQNTEYKIYPQGILFFKRFLPQWQPIDTLLRNNAKANIRLTVSFYHRGRALFFVSTLNLVQNGYALTLPPQVYKMNDLSFDNASLVSASIFREGISGIYARCMQLKGYRMFENRLWMNFSKKDFDSARPLLKNIANLEGVELSEYTQELIKKTKLVMYLPDRHLPEKNHFPYPLTITRNNREILSTKKLEEEITNSGHRVLIPLCESPKKDVHSIMSLSSQKSKISPSDVLETLLLLPVCNYLAHENKRYSLFSNHTSDLSILCITDTKIVLASSSAKKNILSSIKKSEIVEFPLLEGQEYTLKLHIPLETMVRTIMVTITVSKIYSNDYKASCAICSFSNVQEEDKRFLYESFNRAKLR